MGRRFSINIYLEGVEFRLEFASAEEQLRAVAFLHGFWSLPRPPDLPIQPMYGLTSPEYTELKAFLVGKPLVKRKRSHKPRGKKSKKPPHPWQVDLHHVAGGGGWYVLCHTRDAYERMLAFMDTTLKLVRYKTKRGGPLYEITEDQWVALRRFLDAMEARGRP